MTQNVSIIGAGLSKFGRQPGVSGRQMAVTAIGSALRDAGLAWPDVQVAFGGSDGSGLADTLVAELGFTGIPFTNVKNGCATGGSALFSAVNAVRSGSADVALAVGFDKHPRGAFDPRPAEWGLPDGYGEAGLMVTTQFFGAKISRYMRRHDISSRTLALVAEKAYRNGVLNPNAWRREAMDATTIAEADMVNDPLTRYMFCSPGEGAAAIVVASEEYVERAGGRPIKLAAITHRTRRFGSFEVFSPSIQGEGEPTSVSADAARAAFEQAGITPQDVDVAQLQDTESGAEIMHMAECGFCEPGEQEALIAAGETDIGGRLPINTDGGCIANGEPIGASGLRQVHEIVTQLRGEAGERQVPGNPRVGFTHVYGAPGISACTVLTV
ncbi:MULTISPECIES: thiolase family protein [unclassified Rhodococcus (in: high G+C Gram-positive bacteria)]|uniref:thiolase family protein n=1 Tax=unclassified Rhodococcus (in: high G+C Gram-positive bacteria) TaxID=192944 RepID=UPI000B9ABA57|nr:MULTISPECIES: thiolase family protein [unclassified Rhodococcus (in: high G+C Gram-positive bacteria)]OZE37655.1 acetyl-CoA acetyltransferase [Rhodococcus sp. 05-2254-4]OZE40787.1 acetyl-CoA acetyltransferase [Rhodococcus sp. 05-2254-3]OZE45778.1 acetyl-CoA acetyltransferase [Rhodococcus sp. 05-2254-2]OZE46008.1 acetyl-CoA acetyltransferase [Rhodococcus sp. 05-2254-6]OZF52648.1 acetyl-CoA acetyltransferase [Rhodococcus sp. 14-1411-2a]